MFPHREPQFHTGWWSMDHLIPTALVLLLIGVIIWAVIRLTRRPTALSTGLPATPPAGTASLVATDPALELVRQRYARGEIDREAFLQTSRDLDPVSAAGEPAGPSDPESPTT